MGFKDLFIVNEGNETPQAKEPIATQKPVSSSNKFPTSEPQSESTGIFGGFGFNTPSTQAPLASAPTTTPKISDSHLNDALTTYQNGFDSLNQAGYDFYEFYQTIISGGVSNPQIYPMAFAMGCAMDKTLNKEKLIQQSEFYLNEINKVYSGYVSKGNDKKQELIDQKNNENQALLNELNSMKDQLELLKTQIKDRENKLSVIGSKFEPKISDVESKLAANDLAKNTITQSIEQVKQGIQTNIK